MNAVGIFAGRGDVILGYVAALVLGVIIGWVLHRWKIAAFNKLKRKKPTESS